MPIRDATAADVTAIRDVAQASWERDYPNILSRETAESGVGEWYDVEYLREELADPRTVVLVATAADDDVVGFAHAYSDRDEGHIFRVYVHPDHRRGGLGRALLERTCEVLFDKGVDRVNALVLAANEVGNAFYRDHGFEKAAAERTTIAGESYLEHTYVKERPR